MDAFTQRINELWARKLDIPPEAFTCAGTLFFFKPTSWVAANRTLVYRSGQSVVVLLPDSLRERAQSAASRFDATLPITEAQLLAHLPLTRLCWRDFIHYLRPRNREPAPVAGSPQQDLTVSLLNPAHPEDMAALAVLHAALTEEERAAGEVEIGHFVVAGCYDHGKLMAAASFLYDSENNVSDVGVIVHPDHRGRGFGQRVVRYLCSTVEESSLIQYWANEYNLSSVGLARRTGFTRFLIEEGYEVRP